MLTINLNNAIKHLRDRPYMGKIERDKLRKIFSSEVFTPTVKVQQMLDRYDPLIWPDAKAQFLDPTCGDGQFLSEVLIRKLENGIDFETALSTIYGVDLMPDNVEECRKRLLCGSKSKKLIAIVEKNIVCADALKYHYRFDGTPCDPEPEPAQKPKKITLRPAVPYNIFFE